MDHVLEVIKIIEGGIKGNINQVASYASLLADKLEKDGQARQAKSVRSKIDTALSNIQSYSSTSLNSYNVLPVDNDSRLTLGDETKPAIKDNLVLFNSYVQMQLDEFLNFISKSYLLESAGVGIAPSMLIYGPPGCGKTILANHIAAKLELPLITARCDSLISSYLGSTSKNLRSLFDYVASRPCVFFLDEFDALAKARDDQHELGELKRVVVSLLQNIDALPTSTVLLAATNHHELLDPAVWRRFAYRVQIPLPDSELRELLIKQFLGNYSPKNIKPIIDASCGMSGAVIKQACQSGIRSAVLNNSKFVDSGELVFKLIHNQYDEIISSDISVEEKVKVLKELNPKLFTGTKLASIFKISTGKVSNILNKSVGNKVTFNE